MTRLFLILGLAAALAACGPVNAPDHQPTGEPSIERGMEFDCLIHPDEPGCPARIRELVK